MADRAVFTDNKIIVAFCLARNRPASMADNNGRKFISGDDKFDWNWLAFVGMAGKKLHFITKQS